MIRRPFLALAIAALAGCATTPAPVGPATPPGPKGVVTGLVNGPGALAARGAIVAAGGGNLVAAGRGNLVAAGGGNVLSHNGGAMAIAPALAAAPPTRRLFAMAEGFAPVVGARVQIADLGGRVLAETVSDARGGYTFMDMPQNQPLVMRTVFRMDSGKAYYLSALMSLEQAVDGRPLDPINTLIEAKFAALLAARPEAQRALTMGILKELWTAANALNVTIAPGEIEATRTTADLGGLYLRLATEHPSLQPGIKKLLASIGEPAPF